MQASLSLVSDYEDAVMDETAWAIQAQHIVTRHAGDFKRSSVPAVTPRELIRIMGTGA